MLEIDLAPRSATSLAIDEQVVNRNIPAGIGPLARRPAEYRLPPNEILSKQTLEWSE